MLLVVLCLFTQLLDGLVIDFKDCRHGAFAGRDEINFGTFVPDDALFTEMFKQDEHVPRVAHAVETAAEVGSDIVAVPKTKFHTNGDGTCEWKDKEGTDIKSTGVYSQTASLHTKGDGTCIWKETEGVDIKSTNMPENTYLRSSGDGSSSWSTIIANFVEGKNVLSTNVPVDNYLKSNG